MSTSSSTTLSGSPAPEAAAAAAAHPDLAFKTSETVCDEPIDPRFSPLPPALPTNPPPIYVEFAPGDPSNPFNFPRRKKWAISLVCSGFSFLTAIASSSYAMGMQEMVEELGTSSILGELGLGLYPIGFGVAPLVLAPFSEEVGRNAMYLVTYFIFFLMFMALALAPNIASVLVFRLLLGIAASTGSTMVGGTLADMWETHERGLPMSIFACSAILGAGLAPACFSWVADSHLGWRWIQWIQFIVTGAFGIVLVLTLRETRGSVLLTWKARKLRKETGDMRYRARAEDERASLRELIKISATRPLFLLVTEPVVLSFSLWIGFGWAFFYALITSISHIFRTLYGMSLGEVGLVYLTVVVAAILGFFSNFIQERFYQKGVRKRGAEARLYGAMIGGVLFPVGAFIYAWTCYSHVHWIAPCIGITIVMFGVYIMYLAVFNYLSDSYLIYASSALAAQSLCRNVFGGVFPLFTLQMYDRLGFNWASTLVGFLAAALGVVPFILFFFGPTIRAKSHFAKKLARLEEERRLREKADEKVEKEGDGV